MEEPMDNIDSDNNLRSAHLMRSALLSNATEAIIEQAVKQSASRSFRASVLTNLTEDDYGNIYWPKLRGAIDQLLSMKSAEHIPISYEEMYSCVYKCVCKSYSEKLYADLLAHITNYLENVSQSLQTRDAKLYIENFHQSVAQYLQALSGIVPIFNYMNRFYIVPKLRLDLEAELRKLFVVNVADRHVPVIISLLVDASQHPFLLSPPIVAALIKNIYSLKPEFVNLRPHLFAMHIPNVLPPTCEAELHLYAEHDQQMQRDLLTHPDFISGNQNRKRSCDDDASVDGGLG